MYLKSIEIQGFKSFANKIVFDFHNGITGIVGPNGSGKSNVADAVRWVLGEQRVKQLRGGSMQDVIFSGTESRRPLSYASVAITLDNSDRQLAVDYGEVTVTRKLYRSGESEYLLNGSACRLKDINELFYDTGIGKEGYSIIGQGQIDRILSGKPEERRELFDEAAGIVKFKRRKSMSVKKLEDERQNLLRVNDILAELERQLGPLKKQAETAREYLNKKERLRTFDINMFLLETERLKEQIRDAEEKLTGAKAEMEEADASYSAMKEEYESIEEQMDEIDDAIERAKSQRSETNLLKQQLENQIELLKEQINSARMTDEHFGQRWQAIEQEIAQRKENLAQFGKEKDELEGGLREKTQAREEAAARLVEVQSRIASLTDQIEKNKNDIIEILNNRASTQAKIQRYDTMMEQIQVRRSQMNQRLIKAQSEAQEEQEHLEEHRAKLEEISASIRELTEENSRFEEKIEALQKELAGKTEQLRVGQSAYHREASRLESLKNITERYDGYGGSIRRVMEQKEKEKGILGVVADIIKVDKAYEVAIETALGGSIQNIVTDTEETAKRMIDFLKRNRYGRATFLPLTGITGGKGPARPEALREKGVVGLASTLVRADEKYKGLAENLLGRTIVVDHIDNGIAIARKYRQTLRLVTLEGELLNPGGSMTGGAFKNSSNLLSRRREIEEFEKTVRCLKQEMEKTEQEADALRQERSACYEAIDGIQQKLQKAYVVQNTAKMNLDQAKERIRLSLETTEAIRKENQELDQQITDISNNQESITVELDTSTALEQEIARNSEEAQALLEKEKAAEAGCQKASEEAQLACAGLEQKQAFLLENEERIREEIAKFEEEMAGLDASKEDASREIQEKEEQIGKIRLTIEDSREVFAEIEEQIREGTQKKEELGRQHKAFLGKREELSRHMADLDKEIFRLESRKESCEEASEKQINYMWEEYEITYSHALELRDKNLTDLAYMRKQIQTLKNEIRGLGSVNVNAIDDYKEVSERYEFLHGQHADLVEAEATLEKIIAELDEAMRRQFTEQFGRIAAEFDKVFKELFGGGKGTLELMEDEDILEAGIRIIAQPPGKKLQNMMQLSGGEKALTAISLLFAIQNLKPSPFCLLDEIEAALDDSNVTRFAQYLHKLTKNTQFIVITHRRGTMTAADRLYGITMQEKGVSTMVSVSLLEHELDEMEKQHTAG